MEWNMSRTPPWEVNQREDLDMDVEKNMISAFRGNCKGCECSRQEPVVDVSFYVA